MLTRRHGRVRAAAKGVRRTTSRFGARLEPFGHVDVQLAGDLGNMARSLHTDPAGREHRAVRQAARPRLSPVHGGQRDRRDGRAADPDRARAVAAAVPPHARRAEGLAGAEHASTLVLDAYLLRAMATAGWAPALAECAVCGTPGPAHRVRRAAGGVVCPDCRPPGAARPAPATIDLMVSLVDGDWRVADASEGRSGASAAAWSPRTCNGTSSGGCARCRWSTAPDRLTSGSPTTQWSPDAVALRRRPVRSRRPRPHPVRRPAAAAARRRRCPGTWRS